MCSKNCCKVGDILYNINDENDIGTMIDLYDEELNKFEAYREMFSGGGHYDYLLSYYCVEKGHLECLKYISKLPGFRYHSDLALYAIEKDQVECLNYIINELHDIIMPTVHNLKNIEIGPNCDDYVTKLKKS